MEKRYLRVFSFRLYYTLLLGLLCGLISLTASAQDYVWSGQYVNTMPESLFLRVHSVDPAGNSYVAGNFTGIVDVDLSPTGVRSLTAADANGDLFLAKYDPTGKLTWVYQFSGNIGASAIAFNNNKLYVAGEFTGTANVNPAGTATNLDAANGASFFARYTADGQLEMVKQLSAGNGLVIKHFSIDGSDNIYLAGNSTSGIQDADPNPNNVVPLIGHGSDDIFLAKYTSSGVYQWAYNIGSGDDDQSSGLGVDNSGSVYLTGEINSSTPSLSFDPPTNTTVISERGFLAKYSPGGALLWVNGLNVSSKGLVVDGSGNTYLTGSFSGTVDFEPGSGITPKTSAGSTDIFLATYNTSGFLQAVQAMGSSGDDSGTGIRRDADGNLYLMGSFSGTVNFNPAAGPVNQTAPNPNTFFVAKYNASGVNQWVVNTNLTNSFFPYPPSISIDGSNYAYLLTLFSGSGDVDPSANVVSLSATSDSPIGDFALLKYGACPTSISASASSTTITAGNTVTLTASGAATYEWSTGQTGSSIPVSPTVTTAYSVTGTTSVGCSSVSNLTITVITPTITGFAANPTIVCPGVSTTFTTTIGNVTGSYNYTLTNGISLTTGNTSSSALSQSWTAAGFGVQSFTLTVSANGSFTTAVTSLTVGGVGSNTAINYWSGCVNTDWQTTGNWSKGHVPTATEDVVVLVTALNQPTLNGSGTANSVEIQGSTTLTIGSSGTLIINGSRNIGGIESGLVNMGRVDNNGSVYLTNVATPGTQALRNHNTLNNLTGARLVIDRSSNLAFINATGTFINSGSVSIGATVGGSNGIFNSATAINQAGGYIAIDRTSSRAFFNSGTGSSFTNSGTLVIGNITSGANQGLENQGEFANQAVGLVKIDRLNTGANGIANTTGSVINSGTICIGSSATLGQQGIASSGSFTNTAGGLITIDRTTNVGMFSGSSFTNSGTITIGAIGPVGLYSLQTNAVTFSNRACGVLNLHAAVSLSSSTTLVNQGLMVVSTTATHTNSGTMTNRGAISYLLGNPIPNVMNEGIIALPLTICGQSPYSPALQLGASNTLTVGSGWFADAGQTISAGSYSSNTFTPNLPGGTAYTLWFPVTDGGNSCGYSVPLSVSVLATPSMTVTATPSLTITQGQTVTLTASGANSYTWAGATTGNTLIASPASTSVYSVTGTNSTSGCTAVESVTVTVRPIGCGAVIHVTESGSGLQDGSSWANSLPGTSLQLAIDRAATCGGGQVWVASGLYKPTTTTGPNSRTISFSMRNNVAIYGGFVGSETALSGRPAVNPVTGPGEVGQPSSSTLSGDIGTAGTVSDNSYHVIHNTQSLSLNQSAVINGFVIADGNGYSNQCPDYYGGGILNDGASPTITNCLFMGNNSGWGGAVMNRCRVENTLIATTPVITDCVFMSNTAVSGGGVFNLYSQPSIRNVIFRNNYASSGGAIYNRSGGSPILVNSSFESNSALNGGALYNETGSRPQLTNCTLRSNTASIEGGAIFNFTYYTASSTQLTNCVLFNNGGSHSFYNDAPQSTTQLSSISLTYSLFEPASASATGVDVSGPGNLTTNTSPFASATSVALASCSPAINAGDLATTSTTVGITDLVGNSRFYNGGRIDMGAYEFQGVGIPTTYSVLGSGTATCATSPTITLSGSETGVSYQLQRNGSNVGGTTAGTGATISFGPQSLSGVYTVLATGSSGCTAVMATSATVVSGTVAASVSITPTSGTLSCTNQVVSLSAIGSGTVLWSTGASTSVISATTAGTYSVTLTNSAGCKATASATISGTVLRAATVTTDGPVGCGRTSAQITIQATGATSFTLLGPSGYSAVNGTGVFSVTAGGSYTGLAGQSGGCVLSGEVVVGSGGVPPSASDFRASGVLGAGSCTVRLLGTGTGNAFVMTGPNGYVFSNVYRNAGTYPIEGRDVRLPGTYTLTVYSGNCSATYTTVVTGTACSGQ